MAWSLSKLYTGKHGVPRGGRLRRAPEAEPHPHLLGLGQRTKVRYVVCIRSKYPRIIRKSLPTVVGHHIHLKMRLRNLLLYLQELYHHCHVIYYQPLAKFACRLPVDHRKTTMK